MSAFSEPTTTHTDRDLQQRVTLFLSGRHLPSLRRLNVEARDGLVTVRGQLSSFHEKQLVQHGVRMVAGVTRLVDMTRVSNERQAPRSARYVFSPALTEYLASRRTGKAQSR